MPVFDVPITMRVPERDRAVRDVLSVEEVSGWSSERKIKGDAPTKPSNVYPLSTIPGDREFVCFMLQTRGMGLVDTR